MQEPHTHGTGQTSPGGYPLVPSKIVVPGDRGVKVVEELSIHAAPSKVYQFWKDWLQLTAVLPATWSAKVLTPVETLITVAREEGADMQWTHSLINDERGELLAFRSNEQAPVPYAGTIRVVAPAGEAGCRVRVQLDYLLGSSEDAATGPTVEAVSAAVRDALMRCKRALEAAGARDIPANG